MATRKESKPASEATKAKRRKQQRSPRSKKAKEPTTELEAPDITDDESNELADHMERFHSHLMRHPTMQDITGDPIILDEEGNELVPTDRGKTFMGKAVAEQRIFDDTAAARFLAFYAMTGRKTDSAHAAGVHYITVRRWEKDNKHFAELIEEAHGVWINKLERLAYARAFEGVLEPVVNKQGEIVTYVRKYSDKLAEMLLKKGDPFGFGGREQAVEVNVNQNVLIVSDGNSRDVTPLKIERIEDE